MAKKIKFALEMADGVKVRSGLEELREHFDMEKIAGHFLSGKLLEWLEDRYYDNEATKIAELDKDAPNLNAQLCAIIGVDASKYDAFDVEALERLNEKKRLLKERTSDSKIIDNAMLTAFTQEDLADLLDLESPVIYLCGEKFNIPIRVEHKKYVGILGTPKIEIRAASDNDLKAKDIIFENVILPFATENKRETPKGEDTPSISSTTSQYHTLPMEELNEIFDSSFADYSIMKAISRYKMTNNSTDYYRPIFYIAEHAISESSKPFLIENGGNLPNEPTLNKKNIMLKILCNGKYSPDDIVYLRITQNLSAGWAFTKESFCIGGSIGNEIIPYENIRTINTDTYSREPKFEILCTNGKKIAIQCTNSTDFDFKGTIHSLISVDNIGIYMKQYLETVCKLIQASI